MLCVFFFFVTEQSMSAAISFNYCIIDGSVRSTLVCVELYRNKPERFTYGLAEPTKKKQFHKKKLEYLGMQFPFKSTDTAKNLKNKNHLLVVVRTLRRRQAFRVPEKKQ